MAKKFTTPVEKNIKDLLMDGQNPRIPIDKQTLSQDELVIFVAETYHSIAIAKSISSHHYFPSEPLIGMKKSKTEKFTILEGNRRLAALKLLLDSSLREKLSNRKEWDKLSITNVPLRVPVVIVNNRNEVVPVIGYRHISGIQPWDAYAKARYINAQVKNNRDFKKTAIEVGESVTEVQANYRNYRIAEQVIKSKVSPDKINGLINGFGIFTRAIQAGDIREFIGAPAPSNVSLTRDPIPVKKKDELKELVGYLFGDKAVLEESRDITKLGKVISSSEGLKSLRKEGNLEEAHTASGGPKDKLIEQLTAAVRNLRAVNPDISNYKKDSEVKRLLKECENILNELQGLIK